MDIKNGHDDFYIKEGCAVTIGKFDGVHTGHRKLITDVVDRAKVSGIRSCVITIEGFPGKKKDEPDSSGIESQPVKKLTTLEEKKKIIEDLGVDLLVVFSFDEELLKMNPYAFIDSILMDKLNMQSVTICPDFRFGHKRYGKAMTFVKAAMIYGYGVNVLDEEEYNDRPVSSTRIRTALSEGDLDTANKLLGRNYSVSGVTKSGDKIGRKLGFPTMNIYPEEDKLLPPFGVYSTEVSIGGRTYRSVTNVGVRPTVSNNENNVSVESHLLDFKSYGESDYDKPIIVYFKYKIRDEKRFSSENELSDQIKKDIEYLKNNA